MKLDEFITITEDIISTDSDGFKKTVTNTIAEVRCNREGRHGSTMWANLATFSEATDLFTFRVIPGVTITDKMTIVNRGSKFKITSVETVKGKGLYVEALAKKVES